jgi:hypothetical protein
MIYKENNLLPKMGRIKLFEDFFNEETNSYKAGDKVQLEIEPGFIDDGTVIKKNDDGTLEVKWADGSVNKNVKPNDIQLKEEEKEAPEAPEEADEIELDIELSPEDEEDMQDDEEEIDEAADPLAVTSKDIMRIKDIVRKAEGNAYKAKKLAATMCKLITDKWKALRRARAAEREGQSDLADIFTKRATELGALGG